MRVDRRAFMRGLAAAAGLAMLPGRSRAATLPPRAQSVVLVHGAYVDASIWNDVLPPLRRAGLAVATVDNPLTSLADDVATTRRVLAAQHGPVVLVGHSYAGSVISEVGVDPQVSALVYVAARAPKAGEDYVALARLFSTAAAHQGLEFGGGFAQLTEAAFLRDFAGGVDPARAQALFAAQGRIAETLFNGRTANAAWRSKPSFYAVSARDRTTSPDLQRFVAARMNATTIELDAGHLSLLTHPQEVASLILQAAGTEPG